MSPAISSTTTTASSPPQSRLKSLVILYGIGGLSDVGRHAILAALEQPNVGKITVITEYPELLDETNWECNCPGGHTNPIKNEPNRVQLVPLSLDHDDNNNNDNAGWKTLPIDISQYFQNADAVISCLGHRQPGYKYPNLITKGLIAYEGNKQVIHAMQQTKVSRVVICSSIGIEEDKPPLEFHWAGKIMALMFKTNSKKAFHDLTQMERLYKQQYESNIDYLFVRPVGLGEEVIPQNKYYIQQQKGKDIVGINMAKLDCARFMVQEALYPTLHKCGIVVGSEPPSTK